jgi:NodT family efflux transporter outer membrane factor (OMF) lipoprotein
MQRTLHALTGVALVAWLAGCAVAPAAPPAAPTAPPSWHAALPHGGDPAALAQWWASFDDPALPALIERAQARSPGLAQAVARIDESRAAWRAAGAALGPMADAGLRATRSAVIAPPRVLATQASLGVDAQWEIDLFGAARQGVAAQRARTDAARLAWHDARVSLAAEVAQATLGLRSCEALLAVFEQEARSQARSAELTAAKVKVGLEAPANGALADAAAAETAGRVIAQRAECDAAIKLLVMLSGEPEPSLRQMLAPRTGQLPAARAFAVPGLPAQWLAQRPDLAAAERELTAAVADRAQARAERWPQLRIGGSLGLAALRSGGAQFDGVTFGFGPSLVLPLLDGGRRAAAVDAAGARLAAAHAAYDARLRAAVREAEDALVRLDAAQRREADALRAAKGFRAFYDAAESRWRVGTGSLIDMEDARRTALAAQAALLGVQRERVAAWVSLYKAVGGGWKAGDRGPRDDDDEGS